MKNSITLPQLLQKVFCPEKMKKILESFGFEDTAKKFTVYELLKYWISAAIYGWEGYRPSEDELPKHPDLVQVNYSTISKKAKIVPYKVFKEALQAILEICNRTTRRKIQRDLGKVLNALDSTTITVGSNRLPWAPFHGKKAGVKLHIEMDAEDGSISHVEESIAKEHDSITADKFTGSSNKVLIEDRGYAKISRMDKYRKDGHFFHCSTT